VVSFWAVDIHLGTVLLFLIWPTEIPWYLMVAALFTAEIVTLLHLDHRNWCGEISARRDTSH
jgi:Na+-driven multidrug efflux pump